MSELVEHLEAMARIWPSYGVGGTAAKAAARIAALEAGLTKAADFLDALRIRLSQQGFYAQADEVEDAAAEARAALAPAPAPAYANKDGPCDRWAPGAYEVTAPAPAPEANTVPMPQNADQAVLMWLIGERWVRENAPERLRSDAPAPAPEGNPVLDMAMAKVAELYVKPPAPAPEDE